MSWTVFYSAYREVPLTDQEKEIVDAINEKFNEDEEYDWDMERLALSYDFEEGFPPETDEVIRGFTKVGDSYEDFERVLTALVELRERIPTLRVEVNDDFEEVRNVEWINGVLQIPGVEQTTKRAGKASAKKAKARIAARKKVIKPSIVKSFIRYCEQSVLREGFVESVKEGNTLLMYERKMEAETQVLTVQKMSSGNLLKIKLDCYGPQGSRIIFLRQLFDETTKFYKAMPRWETEIEYSNQGELDEIMKESLYLLENYGYKWFKDPNSVIVHELKSILDAT